MGVKKTPSVGMTKKQLEAAQSLMHTYESAARAADALDPRGEGRARDGYGSDLSVAATLRNISHQASDAFHELTGRPALIVGFAELSTEDPAPWTKLPRDQR